MIKNEKGAYAPVFYPSLIIILLFTAFGVLLPNTMKSLFSHMQGWLTLNVGWLYILGMAIFVVFAFFLMFGRLGSIKLGTDHSTPEYSYLSWFAMLFTAGMGIGLMFYGVGEPLTHYLAPPNALPETVAAAKNAMNITFFNWGLQAWSVYALAGLAFGYFSYRHDLPLLPRSALYPILGEKIYGPIGHAVDTFAIIGTIFGVATSLGLGAIQVTSGLNYLIGVPNDSITQIIVILSISFFASLSVGLGLEKGIKRLSNFNLVVAIILLLFVLIFSGAITLLGYLVENTGHYITKFIDSTFNLYAYSPKKENWLANWTLFYWGWWIAWSPFVGMFIARISKGRTIREYIIGVLFVPVGFTFIWMTVFGNSAIDIVASGAGNALKESVTSNISLSLFEFLGYFPFSTVMSAIAVILIITFFVTSADSGALVVDTLATGAAKESVAWHRIGWALLSCFLAIALLLSGGLSALQTASIASALPLLFILLVIMYCLFIALKDDYLHTQILENHSSSTHYLNAGSTWQQRLKHLTTYPTKKAVAEFMKNIVEPAFLQVKDEFEKNDTPLVYTSGIEDDMFTMSLTYKDDFVYRVSQRMVHTHDQAPGDVHEYHRAEVFLKFGSQDYDIMNYKKDQVIADVISQYEKYIHYLHMSASDHETH